MGRKKVVDPEPFRFQRWSKSKSDQSSFPDAIAAGQQQFTVIDLTKPRGHRIVTPRLARARIREARRNRE